MYNKFLIFWAITHMTIGYAAKEIELKISISPEQYSVMENWLNQNARYIGESEQKEWYVTHPNDPWDYSSGFKDTLKTMRVRQEKKGDSFCYKYRHLDPVTKKTTHRDEHETFVDGNTMIAILKLIGYTEQTLVMKNRITYLFNDTFEIVFDDVNHVGKFIEIELKESTDDVKLGIKKIESLLKEIGITEFKQYDRGYIHMIWNPEYDFGIQTNL